MFEDYHGNFSLVYIHCQTATEGNCNFLIDVNIVSVKRIIKDPVAILAFLTLIATFIVIGQNALYRYWDQIYEAQPFFTYTYDEGMRVINLKPSGDFNIEYTEWFMPSLTATSTGRRTSGVISMDDITSGVIDDFLFDGKLSLNPSDPNVQGWVRCQLLNQFTLDSQGGSTSTIPGFPIGLDTLYMYKGTPKLLNNLNVLFLSDTDLPLPEVTSYPLSKEELIKVLSSGSDEMASVLKRAPYDKSQNYLNSDGTCRQLDYQLMELPLTK